MRITYLLIILLLVSPLANVIIYRFLLHNFAVLAGAYKAFGFLSVLGLGGFIAAFAAGLGDFHSFRWGFFFLILLTLPQLIFLVYWLLLVLPLYKLPEAQMGSMFIGLALFALSFGLILHGALIGRSKIITTRATVTSARLPAEFDGFRILQFSDLHAGSFSDQPAFMERLVERINAAQPDMVVFTGDIVNNKSSELDGYIEVLSAIKAPYGVYSVLGNHDYGDYVRWPSVEEKKENLQNLIALQEKMGWQVLVDQHTYIKKDGAAIALIGVENWGEAPFRAYGDLTAAYQGVGKDLFSVLLSHNPSHWRREVLPDTSIDLMLAGHTHAMQVKVAGFSPASLRYKEWSGLYREGGRYLYVNEGVGSVFVPMRIGAYPELTVIELKRVSG